MKEIKSKGELKRILIQSSRCLVDFYAPWCGPCQIMKTILEDIRDIDIFSVNVDNFPDIAARYNVLSLPTIILFENGKPVRDLRGNQTKQNIEKLYQ